VAHERDSFTAFQLFACPFHADSIQRHFQAIAHSGPVRRYIFQDGLSGVDPLRQVSYLWIHDHAGPTSSSIKIPLPPGAIGAHLTRAWNGTFFRDIIGSNLVNVPVYRDTTLVMEWIVPGRAPQRAQRLSPSRDSAPAEFSFALQGTNPGSNRMSLRFGIPAPAFVNLVVYDAQGREVRRLMGRSLDPGEYSVSWDTADNQGRRVASGIYIARFEAGRWTGTQKLIVTH
jgi:hypothetical protein